MKLGFIGGGNMAYAIAGGILSSGLLRCGDIYVYDVNKKAHEKFIEKGITTSCDLTVLDNADYIIIAVKPHIVPIALSDISEKYSDIYKDKVFISIAAGISVSKIKGMLGKNFKVIRVMPNTPAQVGEGMSVLAAAEAPVSDEEFAVAEKIFSSVGKTEVMNENMLSAVVAISGSSPAYIFMLIEAMADAGVRDGLPRNVAYKLAAQSVLGSAKMVLETNMHPAELKDMVCSPQGTTIEAVAELEKCGFRSAIISAMKKCTDKTNNM